MTKMHDQSSMPYGQESRFVIRDMWEDPKTRPVFIWTALVLILGTIFFHFAEGWSWVDSLYFCVITLATVGFGDLAPTTDLTKLVTVFYIINGLGVLVAFFDVYASKRLARRGVEFKTPLDGE